MSFLIEDILKKQPEKKEQKHLHQQNSCYCQTSHYKVGENWLDQNKIEKLYQQNGKNLRFFLNQFIILKFVLKILEYFGILKI